MTSLSQVLIVGLVAITVGLSLANALYSLAAAFVLGAIIQVLQLRLVFRKLHAPHRWLIDNASLGARSLAASLLSTLRIFALFWVLSAVSGTEVVASMQAGINIFMPLNLVLFGLSNLIPQVAARAFNCGDRRHAWRAARPLVLIALPPLVLYLILALCFPQFFLSIFYGSESHYLQIDYLLPSLALFYGAMIPGELIICYFFGIQETGVVLKINLLGAATIAILVSPMFATFGPLEGACIALALGDIVRVGAALLFLYQLTSPAEKSSRFFCAVDHGAKCTAVGGNTKGQLDEG